MNLIIAGGRDFCPKLVHEKWLDELHAATPVTQVVSGMARGADMMGVYWARRNAIEVLECLADWRQYGKAAGSIRNRYMASVADAVALFPGGSGTQDMFEKADKAGLTIYDWRDRGYTLFETGD